MIQHGLADLDGKLIEMPESGCQKYCGTSVGLYYGSDICHGFTFYPATNSCYISTKKDYVLTSKSDAVFYQAKFVCYSQSKLLPFSFLLFNQEPTFFAANFYLQDTIVEENNNLKVDIGVRYEFEKNMIQFSYQQRC